jgi:hypothetical protein
MSLINDALKRAKQAQKAEQPVSSTAPQFMPVEPARPKTVARVPGRRSRRLVPVGLGIVVFLAAFLVWQTYHFEQEDAAAAKAQAAGAQKEAAAAQISPIPVQSLEKTSSKPQDPSSREAPNTKDQGRDGDSHGTWRTQGMVTPEKTPVPVVAETPKVQPAGAPISIPAPALSPGAPAQGTAAIQPPPIAIPAQVQPPAVAPETPPQGPPPLRLQAIIYRPTRASAMINGRTLFVGDEFGNLRVVAIGQTSVTLAGGGQTNVLKLAQ